MILALDQEWLGVGRIRCGFVINGILYYVHQFLHNDNSNSVQYTTTPRQYITHYLSSTNMIISMRQMCCTSISEGGYLPLGTRNNISNKLVGIDIPNSSSTIGYIALALRINSSYPNGMIKPIKISIATDVASGKMSYYEIQVQTNSSAGSVGSITGTLNYTQLVDSIAEYAIGDSSQRIVTSGYILDSGYISSRSDILFTSNDYETLLTRTICSQYDTIYIVVYSNASCSMFSSLDFIESI